MRHAVLNPRSLRTTQCGLAGLAGQLTEQLRVLLEPTQARRLAGDFSSGKRLSMRKVGLLSAAGVHLCRAQRSCCTYAQTPCCALSCPDYSCMLGASIQERCAVTGGCLHRVSLSQRQDLVAPDKARPAPVPGAAPSGAWSATGTAGLCAHVPVLASGTHSMSYKRAWCQEQHVRRGFLTTGACTGGHCSGQLAKHGRERLRRRCMPGHGAAGTSADASGGRRPGHRALWGWPPPGRAAPPGTALH